MSYNNFVILSWGDTVTNFVYHAEGPRLWISYKSKPEQMDAKYT